MYKREATEYDMDYSGSMTKTSTPPSYSSVACYQYCQLSHLFSQAGLFSAVSSAFVIDTHSNLQPDLNEQSVALLRAILLTLNQSAIPGETPTVPPVQEGPPSEIVTVTCLMYASLLVSMLAAFVAMLGKQWLNWYLRNSGGSMIERCGDRQRKCDGLEKWPLHYFGESLPLMLQIALLLLACGLCRYMWSINASVAYTLIGFTGVGVVFYVAIVIAGMSLYACPFQTPVSIALRGPWKKVRRGMVSSIVLSKRVLSQTHKNWNRGIWSLLRRQSPPTTARLEDIQVHESEPWLEPKDLAIIRRTNASDAGCASWILGNITDPEARDAAMPLAGEIQWFDDGIDVDPPYDQIVSTFKACFDPSRKLYPGSRDRAYYSGRAMVWISVLAMCKSREFARRFPLPDVEYKTPVPDPDLEHLLQVNSGTLGFVDHVERLLIVNPGHTNQHLHWISNLLLHYCYSWADLIELDDWHDVEGRYILDHVHETGTTIPLNASLNRLLVWHSFLGSPAEKEALKIKDKLYDISYFCGSSCSLFFTSDRMDLVVDRVAQAVTSAINDARAQREFIPHILRNLIKLETRPECLTKIAYQWCSVIYENRESLEDWGSLLLVCLEIGFRHLDFQRQDVGAEIAHTEHHRELVDVVFKGQQSEAIADLLQAWTARPNFHGPAYELLGFCAGPLTGLHHLVPFSPRLRRSVIRSVEIIGWEGFEGVGVERFVELLDHLHVTIGDMDEVYSWEELLLDIIRSPEGTQHLFHWYWELLVELILSVPWSEWFDPARRLQIMTFLAEAKEWSKLECWMGIVWILVPREENAMAAGDLHHSMLLLFRQRPGAVQKLEQWMERWSRQHPSNRIPESFEQIFKQAHEAAQQDTP